MYWTDMDHSFCEASINGLPEYYNSISSLFIIMFGIYGMMNKTNELFIDILYANLSVVGFGSVGYHWYGNIGWGLLDEIPMILAIYTGIIYADNVHYLIYNNNNNNNNIINNNSLVQKQIINQKKGRLLLYFLSMVTVIITNVMENFRRLFPAVFTGAVLYLYYKIFLLLQIMNPIVKPQVMTTTKNTLCTIAASGTIWVTTEISCNYFKYRIFLLGHPMWHFFIGHGFYNLIQLVYFIKQNNMKNKLSYNKIYLLQIENAENEMSKNAKI